MADGVFYAELNELLTRELAEDGYAGVEVRVTPMRTEIIIRATRTQKVLGKADSKVWILCLELGSFCAPVCLEWKVFGDEEVILKKGVCRKWFDLFVMLGCWLDGLNVGSDLGGELKPNGFAR